MNKNKNINETPKLQTDTSVRFEAGVIPPSNIIYNEDCIETMRRLPDKCVSLIIADPPYYKIKGEFDWVWNTFEEYLNWMEGLAKEFKRILADNGSLFVYSHAKRVAYIQVIYDKYFHLGNNITWKKTECQTRRTDFEQARYFAPVTERILFYDNETDMTGLEKIKLDVENFASLRQYFRELQVWINEPKNNIIIMVGQKADHCFRWGSTQWDLPTQETYNELQKYYNIRRWERYREYEELRRPFNNILKLEDVMEFGQEGQNSGRYDHETIKPLKLSKALVATCSKENDLVYIPFVGSGTECVAVNELNRIYLGSEINKKYCEIAEARIRGSRRQNYDMFYDHKAV